MATDTTAGFKYMGRMSGQPDIILRLKTAATATLTKGDMLTLSSGEAALGATNDSAFLGIALETVEGVDSETDINVIAAPDAVYAVYDANARAVGATLDLSGATGAQTVAASSNADFVVIAPSTADEWTLVIITQGNHAFN